MGYTYLDDEEGYMLIPDGNGALINLDNKEGRYTTGFSQNIYGSDAGFDDSEVKTYLWDKIDMVEDANEVTNLWHGSYKTAAWIYRSSRKR